MALSDIAEGIEVTAEQCDRGVPTVDDTDAGLAERLAPHAEALPCTPEAAATLLDAYAGGASVGDAGRAANVAPMTAAKALHRCGRTGVSPLGPTGREVVRDWLAGDLSRTDALTLARVDEAAFALAAYVETHEADPDLADAVEGALEPRGSATVSKRDALAATMSDVTDFQ